MKNCPFKSGDCTSDCALFISTKELNETVANRLKSLGVISCEGDGICTLKNIALAQSRYIFQNTKVFNS